MDSFQNKFGQDQLYKTQMCKHFIQYGQCVKGSQCHFAHGEADRRQKEDMQRMIQQPISVLPYNNYKTQMCKYFEIEKHCKFGNNCTYAHGREELRQPYEDLPVNALPKMLPDQRFAKIFPYICRTRIDDTRLNQQILECNSLFQLDKKEQAMQVLQNLMNQGAIQIFYLHPGGDISMNSVMISLIPNLGQPGPSQEYVQQVMSIYQKAVV